MENGTLYAQNGGKMKYNEKLNKYIPEKWEVINLGEYLRFDKGVEVGTENYYTNNSVENLIKFYRVSDMDDLGNTFVPKKCIDDVFVNETDILVSFDGTPGKIGIALNGSYSTGMKKVSDPNNIINNAFIYVLFNSNYIQYIINQYSSGSNIKHASESLNHMFIPFDENVYSKFSARIVDLYNQILLLTIETKQIKKTRDYLLPLLMNGQIKIED